MKQVPLPPLERGTQLNSEPLPEGAPTGAPPKKRGIFRRTYRGAKWLAASPVQWMGVRSIRQGASFIGDLTARARARPMRDPRFKTEDEGDFDLRATAFSMGMTVGQLERRLADRRRQTAMMAYLLGVLGLIAFAGWFVKVISTPMAAGRLVLAVDFLPLCALFMLLGFYQALVNFQIRAGRTAGWREYLATDQGFWPRP